MPGCKAPLPPPTCSPNLPSPKRFVQAGKFFGRRERLALAEALAKAGYAQAGEILL